MNKSISVEIQLRIQIMASSIIYRSEYIPRASLIMKTGQPVMRNGGSVILQLDNDDGLQGWNCWVYRGQGRTGERRIKLRLKNDSVSLDFQPTRLMVPETIFWCSDSTQQHRSNQVMVRTSGGPTDILMLCYTVTFLWLKMCTIYTLQMTF